jgi:hypothetical protein
MSPEDRRKLAVDLFNHVWTLLEKPERTVAEDDEMVHAAHASRLHWGHVGTAVNLVRGEWQIARVYATLGRGEPALYHARRCLELCDGAELEEWDLPFAYEALARANLAAGNEDEARRYADLARREGAKITDADDRELLEQDLLTLP